MDNWLITLLAIILLLAVLDGVRRALRNHRAAMKVSRNLTRSLRSHFKDGAESEDGEGFFARLRRAQELLRRAQKPLRRAQKPEPPQPEEEYLDPEERARRRQIARELPGSVRVVQRRAPQDSSQINREVKERAQEKMREQLFAPRRAQAEPAEPGAPREAPEQGSLNLEQQVPTLMDSLPGEERREPLLDESDSLRALEERAPAAPVAPPPRKPEPTPTPPLQPPTTAEKRSKPRAQQPVEEVLVINVMARPGDYFEGNDLLRVLLAEGLRFGSMHIFHRYAGEAGEGPVLFSLANMLKPGTFDLSHMEEFTSPGLSLFLTLPVEGEAPKVFELLLHTAHRIAEQLGGELKDENRSVFTAQTAEHYRQRVLEFQRRKALSKAPV